MDLVRDIAQKLFNTPRIGQFLAVPKILNPSTNILRMLKYEVLGQR